MIPSSLWFSLQYLSQSCLDPVSKPPQRFLDSTLCPCGPPGCLTGASPICPSHNWGYPTLSAVKRTVQCNGKVTHVLELVAKAGPGAGQVVELAALGAAPGAEMAVLSALAAVLAALAAELVAAVAALAVELAAAVQLE